LGRYGDHGPKTPRYAHGVIRNTSSTTQWLASLVSTQNLVLLLAIEHFFVKAAKTTTTHNAVYSKSVGLQEFICDNVHLSDFFPGLLLGNFNTVVHYFSSLKFEN